MASTFLKEWPRGIAFGVMVARDDVRREGTWLS
jgi:hypothetical protein